jgi:hypothetical protein
MKTTLSNPGEDLQAIRDIMERSSKFISLSGLSGIFAGLCALAGAAVAWFFIPDALHLPSTPETTGAYEGLAGYNLFYMVLVALLVLVTAAMGATWFSFRKARKAGQPFWTHPTRRLLINLLIPLAAGGLFTLILLYRNHPELAASAMLIFYGLALVNAGKFTFGEIHYLGLTEIMLGILAGIFVQYGFLIWTIGFGLMHIVYGTAMYYRHER